MNLHPRPPLDLHTLRCLIWGKIEQLLNRFFSIAPAVDVEVFLMIGKTVGLIELSKNSAAAG